MLVGARPGLRLDLEDEVLSAMAGATASSISPPTGHYLYRGAAARSSWKRISPRDDAGAAEFREYLRGPPGRAVRDARRPRRRGLPRGPDPVPARRDRQAVIAAAPRAALPRHAPRRRAVARLRPRASGATSGCCSPRSPTREQFAPWLDALEEAGARLAGVYSVPLLAPALAARLGRRARAPASS